MTFRLVREPHLELDGTLRVVDCDAGRCQWFAVRIRSQDRGATICALDVTVSPTVVKWSGVVPE